MELVVDLAKVTVVLKDPDDLEWLAVRVGAPTDASPASPETVHRLGDVLAAANVGRLDPTGDAFVRLDALRFHAAGQVGPEWDERLAATCRSADAQGWVDRSDGSLRARVVWPSPDGVR